MREFFRYETELPVGSGFELFGMCHVTWLCVIAVGSFVLACIYKNKDADARRYIRICIGIVMPLISIYRDVVLTVTGHFDRYYLPLHLCGMALYIGALYCFTKWRFAGIVYVLLCVPGAASALLFPDWVAYPFWNYMHIHDFISHGLIVAWGSCLLVSEEVLPKWNEFWMPVVFGVIGVLILTPVNKWLGTNYWFLTIPSAGSPLVPIAKLTGEQWYVVGYMLFVLVVVGVWMSMIRGVHFFNHYLKERARCAILTGSEEDD